MKFKRGQVTIFIIIAIILVALVGIFFLVKDKIILDKMPVSIDPMYRDFLTCIEEDIVKVGIDVLESQAGYIEIPEFDPGSSYMPFSNHLDFLGNAVPYWYYVSGNNIQTEQVPSKRDMAEDLANFIEDRILDCSLEEYAEQGFYVVRGAPKADVSIKDNYVDVDLNMELGVIKGEDRIIINNHDLQVKSKLGKLYDSAKKIYDIEQDELFLEGYGVDTLRLYAPVDGVELTCSPMTWIGEEVFFELRQAIEANTLAIKSKGADFTLQEKENKYFVRDFGVDENVQFLTSMNWPYSIDVDPSDGSILMAKPVGNQPNLGILGFCYVPYHFVYNLKYPVMIQVYDGDEIFQFPVAIVISGNNPREPVAGVAMEIETPELCEYKNTFVGVNVYDNSLNYVDADISFECFGKKCDIGKTESGFLEADFPQCVNGYIRASAEGYKDARYLYSTTQEGYVDILMERLYEKEINLKVGGNDYLGDAIITFISEENSQTVVYPEQKSIELSEGQYEVEVYVYESSSLMLASSTSQQCVEVPNSGIGGLFGLTREKCFDIDLPEQLVSNALAGGGKQSYYILESELVSSNVIEIGVDKLPTPSSLEQLQNNYNLFEEKKLEIYFI